MTSPGAAEPPTGLTDGTSPRGPNVSHGVSQCALSPGLPPHPGTWSPVRPNDSLGLLHQPLGVESLSALIWTLGATDTAGLASIADAMCATCERGMPPLRGLSQSCCQQIDFKMQSGKSGGLRGAGAAASHAFPGPGGTLHGDI